MQFSDPNFDEESKQYIIKIEDETVEHIIYKDVNIGVDNINENTTYFQISDTIDLNNIYDNMISIVEEKVGEWFKGKKITKNFLETKLKKDNKVYIHETCKAYNTENKRILLEDIDTTSTCDIALSVRGVWFKKTTWGIFISITQMRQDVNYENDSLFQNEKKEEENEEIKEETVEQKDGEEEFF